MDSNQINVILVTKNEYESLAEFAELPLYDDDQLLAESLTSPEKELPDGFIVASVCEAVDLEEAQANLGRKDFAPQGGIRYLDGDGKNPNFAAIFWVLKKIR